MKITKIAATPDGVRLPWEKTDYGAEISREAQRVKAGRHAMVKGSCGHTVFNCRCGGPDKITITLEKPCESCFLAKQ